MASWGRVLSAATFVSGLAGCLGAGAALSEETSSCEVEAELRCGSVEDAAERERCLVEREMECELHGPRRRQRKAPAESATFRGACRADFDRLCAEIGHDGSRTAIVSCLADHLAELSEDCRKALERRPEAPERP